MPYQNSNHQPKLEELLSELRSAFSEKQAQENLNPFSEFLVQSEQQLLALMQDSPPPTGGEIEFGMVLYWIYNDLPTLLDFLKKLFPAPKITKEDLANWKRDFEGAGVVSGDGTLVSYGRYAQLDKGWAIASVLYILSMVTSWVPKAPFGSNPAQVNIPKGQTVRVAVVGDWGTGTWSDQGMDSPSQKVMDQVEGLQVDYTIHLGDVYYAGMGALSLKVDLLMAALATELGIDSEFTLIEELERFTQLWKSGTKGTFTLNSNHEMYSGAMGYFKNALSDSLFQGQQGTSYFSIVAPNWAIVGLDSAFFTTSLAYMEGRLQDSTHTEQIQFVQGLNLGSRQSILMTHHTGLTYDGQPMTSEGMQSNGTLVTDVQEAFGCMPSYWYWGHTHNAIAYTDKTSFGSSTKARCMGHGAIPFGKAYVWQEGAKLKLDQLKEVEWYAHTPMPNHAKIEQLNNRVLNGFAVLTLSDTSIIEEFYEVGNSVAVWTKTTSIPS